MSSREEIPLSRQQYYVQLFQEAVDGDEEASNEFREYLHEANQRLDGGDQNAREELESLAYGITYRWAECRMERWLQDRGHSVASLVHAGYFRILKKDIPLPVEGLSGLCLRVGSMLRFAILDLVKSQKDWDSRNQFLENRNQETPDACTEIEDPAATVPDALSRWQSFSNAVEELPEDVQTVWNLSYYERTSIANIAKLLGITEHEVRKRLMQAKAALGVIVKDLFG